METLEIHAKSYLVKWVNAPDNSIIDWQVQPLRKSINFTIYRKRIEAEQSQLSDPNSPLNLQPPNLYSITDKSKSGSVATVNEITKSSPSIRRKSRSRSNSTLGTNIVNSDLNSEKDYGKLLPNELVKGKFKVDIGGTFAFLFDNSFSKTTGKKVYFNSEVVYDDSPITTTEKISNKSDIDTTKNSSMSRSGSIKNLSTLKTELDDSFNSRPSSNIYRPKNGEILESILYKKRRKRHQGFTKRYFTLNLKQGVIAYHQVKSNKIRGSMPIKHSIISGNKSKLEIIIDSGMEIWDLKALNENDFDIWIDAFNLIKSETERKKIGLNNSKLGNIIEKDEIDEIDMIDELSKLSFQINKIKSQLTDLGHQDVFQDDFLPPSSSFLYSPEQKNNSSESFKSVTSQIPLSQSYNHISPPSHAPPAPPPQHQQQQQQQSASSTSTVPFSGSSNNSATSAQQEVNTRIGLERKSSIWKRSFSNLPLNKKTSQSDISPTSPMVQPRASFNLSSDSSQPNSKLKIIINNVNELSSALGTLMKRYESNMIAIHNQRQTKDTHSISGQNSILSTERQEFYDAEDYLDVTSSRVILFEKPKIEHTKSIDGLMRSDSNMIEIEYEDYEDTNGDISLSSSSDDESVFAVPTPTTKKFEIDLYPLPLQQQTPIIRRKDIPVCDHSPPSILSFVRRNVGKDLSTIAMPVTMNEPLTILQKFSEIVEYCSIINNALESDERNGERILRIASFAVSYLSTMRAKERNSRKPFNPLLGETFELVREDFGVRLIAEKVCHRPQIFAMFIESANWEINYSPAPDQKFWGKNAEIVTSGILTLTIKSTGEVFQWSQPRTLLKNVIAGEKYTEPSSNITITSSAGQKAIVEFKTGGMFSGRSEDLNIKAFDKDNTLLPYTVKGKWTEGLTLTMDSTETTIWSVGKLINNYPKKFGFTEFAASLNEITTIEKGKFAPTDSRLRPDINKYELGLVDEAEKLKLKLEEDQRQRRKTQISYKPSFFIKNESKNDNDGFNWVFIEGEKSYWNRRKVSDWGDLTELW